MRQLINVDFPKELAFFLKMKDNEFAEEIKRLAIIKLYEIGKISSGKASQILGIERVEFLESLKNYKVSFFSYTDEDELRADIKHA
ncbi:MAG: UPF0175 family protein [Bacteroidetes bacterium]|nr:UPF0175 family protein [Bacteroidota bacterium]